jgi:hypothetical protein
VLSRACETVLNSAEPGLSRALPARNLSRERLEIDDLAASGWATLSRG